MTSTAASVSSQWRNPSDILSVLLIIGGDVIQKALAQLSGDSVVPVAFSFGWVAYSFTTLMSVVGDGRLMPPPDHLVKVINAANGNSRENRSWVLGRLLRDFESPLPANIGLHATVFQATEKEAGKPEKDGYWISGLVLMLIQLGIAAIPWGLYNDWGVFLVTACGTVLALLTGSLPQWRFEKWACRRDSKKTVILTGGNGTRHVMVIQGVGKGLDLEDLAAADSPRLRRWSKCRNRPTNLSDCNKHGTVQKDSDQKDIRMLGSLPVALQITQVLCVVLAALWIVFLITVAGLKDYAWFLLAIGGLGMIQNVVIAGASRKIGTTGIHLKKIKSFEQSKVMDTLMDLEIEHKGVGRSLLEEFFSGKLRPAEESWWNGSDKKTYDDERRQRNTTESPAVKEHETV